MIQSYKDTFAADSFGCNSFRCGTFRGSANSAAVSGPYRVSVGSVYVAGQQGGGVYLAGQRNASGYVAGAQFARVIE